MTILFKAIKASLVVCLVLSVADQLDTSYAIQTIVAHIHTYGILK